jgi:Tol biopolymer transport system component
MRDVDDMSWAPDGSALVATINTAHTTSPTLAIASTDKYMHQLGINAMAATWSPNSRQDITYVVQSEGQTQLWNITAPSGQTATMQMTLPEQLLIHCLRWSPDGQYLALIVSGTGTRTNSAQTQTGRSIYILNTMTRKLTRLVAPGNFTIGNVAWSPNGRYLTYEQTKPQGNTLLQSINVSHPQQLFTILPQHLLQGWSWSPDSQALVYSEGGMLQAHVLYGAPLLFSHNNDQLTSPFWLKDGRILCLQITHNKGQLAFLATTT